MIPSTLLELEEEFTKACTALGVHAELHGRAKAIYDELEDYKKVVEAKQTPNEGTVAHKEKAALTSSEYQLHLKGLAEARLKFEVAKAKFIHAQADFERLRTIITNKRILIEKGIDHA